MKKNHIFLLLGLVLMAVQLAIGPIQIMLPVIARSQEHFPIILLGALKSGYLIGYFFGGAIAARLLHHFKRASLITLSMVVMGVCIAAIATTQNPWLILVFIVLSSFGSAVAFVLLNSQIMAVLPPQVQSRIGSNLLFMEGSASVIGFFLGGVIVDWLGVPWLCIISSVLLVCVAQLFVALPFIRNFIDSDPAAVIVTMPDATQGKTVYNQGQPGHHTSSCSATV